MGVQSVKWLLDMKQKADEGVSNLIDSVVNFFKELPGKIWNWLVETVVNMAQWTVDMRDKATNGISECIDNIINFFKELPRKDMGVASTDSYKYSTMDRRYEGKSGRGNKKCNRFNNKLFQRIASGN